MKMTNQKGSEKKDNKAYEKNLLINRNSKTSMGKGHSDTFSVHSLNEYKLIKQPNKKISS